MAEPGDVWWEIDIVARNLLKVSLPSGVLRMPPDQARRFAQALNLAADATGEPKRPSTSEDRCAPLVEALERLASIDTPPPWPHIDYGELARDALARFRGADG